MDMRIIGANDATYKKIGLHLKTLKRLARLDRIESEKVSIASQIGGHLETSVADLVAQGGSIQLVLDEATYAFPLDGVIDLDAERSRITKVIEAATKERDALAGRLSNAAFVEKAKPEAVEKARADHAEKAAEAERLTAALTRLG